jgi:hypothetical protein
VRGAQFSKEMRKRAGERVLAHSIMNTLSSIFRPTTPAFSRTDKCLEIAGSDIISAKRSTISPAVISPAFSTHAKQAKEASTFSGS